MKKLFIIILSTILFSSTYAVSDDISDFEIEGMSIGDSLLDYLTEEKIVEWIEKTKDHYSYLKEPNKYASAYIFINLTTYDYVSFIIKNTSQNQYITKKGEKYIILSVRGGIDFNNDFDGCINKRDEILKIISNMFPDAPKSEELIKTPLDPSGESFYDLITFRTNRAVIALSCNDWEETFRIKNNYREGLSLDISLTEVDSWMRQHK